jgi:peptidoglycan/LPS O-acetylase OafA/YrhL
MPVNKIKKEIYSHIQILRAFAVVIVVGFHMGWEGFQFGYLGVDIFFVISGFLMYKIYESLDTDKIQTFYLKRVSRLLPAYVFMSLLTLITFMFFVLPFERYSIVKQNLAASFFASNFYYWTENQYFVNSGLKPILSFWSLALEMQFYLIFPLIIPFFRRSQKLIICTIIASLFMNIILVNLSPETAFFLLFSRLWEFLIGVLVCMNLSALRKRINFSQNSAFFVLFMLPVLIVCAGFVLTKRELILNVLVVFYSAVIIVFGFILNRKSGPLLSVLLNIGKYSYSIYLVHLPIISIVSYSPFSGNKYPGGDLRFNVITLILIYIFSWLLFNIVEHPFRNAKSFSFLLKTYFLFVLISFFAFVTFPYYKNVGVGIDVQKISFSQEDRSPYRCGTFSRIEIIHELFKLDESCLISKKRDGINYLLIGNSHASSIQTALGNEIESTGNSLYMLRDPLALNYKNLKIVQTEVINRNIDTVVMHSSPGQLNKSAVIELVNFLESRNSKLVIIGPIPVYEKSIPLYLYNNLNQSSPATLGDLDLFKKLYDQEILFYSSLSNLGKVLYLDSLSVFCKNQCRIIDAGLSLYFDSNHLTDTGAEFLISTLKKQIKTF